MICLFLTAMVATRRKQKRSGVGCRRKTKKPRTNEGKGCILIAGHWTKYCATPLLEEPGKLC